MLIVQKFGGSSLASVVHVQRVAEKIRQSRESGQKVVIVVSAMGDTTDDLIEKAYAVSSVPKISELDALVATGEWQSAALLSMCLNGLGIPAQSFTGGQAGIAATDDYGNARILHIDPSELKDALERGIVPVVTGFQGETAGRRVATLGRGGSDLTAIALASALDADRCEIYSDVAGVYTADPRIISTATALKSLSFDEMMELASQGAQVLQTQAVAYAKSHNVDIHARSTFVEAAGTVISNRRPGAKPPVAAVAINRHIAKIGVMGVPDAPGVAALIFSRLAEKGINVDLVFQALSHDQLNDVAFTVEDKDALKAEEVARGCLSILGGRNVVVDRSVAKVSAVGSGMLGRPGVAAGVFSALADAKINIQMIGTSEIKISCIVARSDAEQALRQIHQYFALDKDSPVIED